MIIDRRLAAQLGFLAFLGFILLFTVAAVSARVESRAAEELVVEGPLEDIAFFAGGEVALNPVSGDDVIAAGGEVLSEGLTARTLIVAGGQVDLAKLLVEDAFVAGGGVSIPSGTIRDDLTVAAGELRLGRELDVGGTLHATGGEVTLHAAIGHNLRAAAADLSLDGSVSGDAYLVAERLVIGPRTRISGDLRYQALKAEIDPSAIIEGETEQIPWPKGEAGWSPSPAKAVLSGFLAFAATVIGAGLVAVVVAVALPALVTRTQDHVRRKPLASLGIGVLIALLGPAVILGLGLSIVGLLLGGVLFLLLLLLLPLGLAAMAFTIGRWLQSLRGKDPALRGKDLALRGKDPAEAGPASRAVWTAIGYLAALVVSLVPFIGPLLWLVIAILGTGALARSGFHLLRTGGSPAAVV